MDDEPTNIGGQHKPIGQSVSEAEGEVVQQDQEEEVTGSTNSTHNPIRRNKFQWKLHQMLRDVEDTPNEAIVSWTTDGKAFIIHQRKSFMKVVAPRYFSISKFKSFQRQLYLYNFSRNFEGDDEGAYYHKHFLRNDPSQCSLIERQETRKTAASAENTFPATEGTAKVADTLGDSNATLATVWDTQTQIDIPPRQSSQQSPQPTHAARHPHTDSNLSDEIFSDWDEKLPPAYEVTNFSTTSDFTTASDFTDLMQWLGEHGVLSLNAVLQFDGSTTSTPHYSVYADEIIKIFGSN